MLPKASTDGISVDSAPGESADIGGRSRAIAARRHTAGVERLQSLGLRAPLWSKMEVRRCVSRWWCVSVGAPRRTARDQRRRTYSQNFLVDPDAVRNLLSAADLQRNELVVEFGAGSGVLTLPLAQTGARVVAVERDAVWTKQLRRRLADARLSPRVHVVHGDLRRVSLPTERYRVISNVPFSLTTALLSRLLDDPEVGPWRADLLVQWEVAKKRATHPPSSLRSAAWSPWWEFHLGDRVSRTAFRPVPAVDAGWLICRKRQTPVLPPWMAKDFSEALRGIWHPPPGQ